MTTTRIPKLGDRVLAAGENEVFEVVKVNREPDTVDAKFIGAPDRVKRFPWGVLSYPKEDVNQAAARIVREATDSK